MHTTIFSKFQVVIPKRVRRRLNLWPKQRHTVIERDAMLVLIPKVALDSQRGIATGAEPDDYSDRKDRT